MVFTTHIYLNKFKNICLHKTFEVALSARISDFDIRILQLSLISEKKKKDYFLLINNIFE